MKISRFLLPFLILFCSSGVSGQNRKADSLLKNLPVAKDTNRVMALSQLSYAVHNSDPELAKKYAWEAITLAEKLDYESGKYDAYMKLGMAYHTMSLNDSAIYYYSFSRKIAESVGDSGMLNTIYLNIGNSYGEIGENRKCLSFYLKACDYTDFKKNPKKYAAMKVNIGTVYSVLGQHDSSIVFYNEGARTLEKINPDDFNLQIIYGNIGATYIETGDTAKAEIEFRKAQRIAQLSKDPRSIAITYDYMSAIAIYKHQPDTAIALCKKALAIYREIDHRRGISEVCVHIGEIYNRMKMPDSAAVYLSTGARLAEEIKDYYNLDNFYAALSKTFEAKGSYDSALFYQRKLQQVKDTLYNLNKSSLVSEMETKLKSEKQQAEIELLNAKDARKDLLLYGTIVVAVLILLMGILALNRYLVKKRSNELLSKQNSEIQEQKEIIEEKNKDITGSIRYAQRIQNAIMPSPQQMQSVFDESWCFFKPKDIVSGDFYWFEKEGDYRLFAVVDCTGHGVPGALLSIVGHNLLGKALHDLKLTMPDQILQFLSEEIQKILRQKKEDATVQDGMDIAICSYHVPSRTMYYAGAVNPLYIFRQSECIEIKADKILLGSEMQADKTFTRHSVNTQPGDLFFLFSDGFADQFGGAAGKKLKYKNFRQVLLNISAHPMEQQSKLLSKAFDDWKSGYDQIDDVCVAAIKI